MVGVCIAEIVSVLVLVEGVRSEDENDEDDDDDEGDEEIEEEEDEEEEEEGCLVSFLLELVEIKDC